MIYYASADSVKHAMSLPQCEEVRSRGFEIIYLTSALDEMVIENLMDQDAPSAIAYAESLLNEVKMVTE